MFPGLFNDTLTRICCVAHNMIIYKSFLYIRQQNTQINNSLPHLCQLSLFNLRYSYATRLGYHGVIIRRYNTYIKS
jgi:hypothetical protein